MTDPKDPKAVAKGDEQSQTQVTVVDDAVTENPNDSVTIDLNASKQAATPTTQTAHDSEIVKMQRRMEYQTRQVEKLTRQIQELTQNVSRPGTVQTPKPDSQSTDGDDLDQIAERDWKKAVRILAEKEAKTKIEEYERNRTSELEKQKVTDELSKSKARVIERYPQLEDETSDEAQAYVQVLNENPLLLNNPYGPELAMYKMEERLRTKPLKRDTDIEKEINRRTRVGSAYVPPGARPATNQIVLTKSEQEYCVSHNIPFDQFAKMKSFDQARLKEGVEVE